jgi:hypothetical protein
MFLYLLKKLKHSSRISLSIPINFYTLATPESADVDESSMFDTVETGAILITTLPLNK